MQVLAISILVPVCAFFWLVYLYNGFIRLGARAAEAWSGVDVQLKRRYDLIPNLVETVKAYARHEQETFARVVAARNSAVAASGIKQQAQAEDHLSGAVAGILALAENYPELKASQNFLDLQKSLNDVEDQIQLARRYYNAVVRDRNTLCGSFPSVLVAKIFGFAPREFFEIRERERSAPLVAEQLNSGSAEQQKKLKP